MGLPEDLQTGRRGQTGLVKSIGFLVGLIHIFHMNLFFIKNKTCICHLASHVENYLVRNVLL